MFNEPKAIRLAFHDCMPYDDGGGCDGCLNFEVNEDEHNVLQHSVAILVSSLDEFASTPPLKITDVSFFPGEIVPRKRLPRHGQ